MNNNIHSDDHTQSNPHQQQNQEPPPQNIDSKKPLTVNSKDYVDILNIIAELGLEAINENHDFSTQEKKEVEEYIKKDIKTYSTPFGSNLQLSNGKPVPTDTLLCEPKDQGLANEKNAWDMKTREALRQSIQDRNESGKRIQPLYEKAINIETSKLSRGVFTDPPSNEFDGSLLLDPKYPLDMKKEFKDSMQLLENMPKETTRQLDQFAEVGRLLEAMKSMPPSPQ